MKDNIIKLSFDRILNVSKIITIFYMEFSKNFYHDGESHDFWEMVYIDKGEMICTADKKRFVLKSGEMTFHKPNEFHNLSGDGNVAPNVSIITFECKSRSMKYFEGKIFRLSSEEKSMLAALMKEGLSCYRLQDVTNPLMQKMRKLPDAPIGSSQMTKNLLEAFLIGLMRHTDVLTKEMRTELVIDGVRVPERLKEILDFLSANISGKLTITDVARYTGKSESAVKQLFSDHMSEGIISYYIRRKISEAKRLIREDKYNMTQISDMLKFDTPQYFSKCFKRVTNMTPSEYKLSILERV